MIKVNLLRNLGSTAAPGAATFQSGGSIVSEDVQKQAIYRIAAIIAIVGLLMFYEKFELSRKQTEVDQVSSEIDAVRNKKAKFGDAAPMVEHFNEQKKALDAQIRVLETLTENRLREVKLLDAVQSIMPPKAWLELVKVEQGKVVMSGFAPNEASVTELYRALESNVLFSNVRVKSEAKDASGTASSNVQRFEFTFQAGKAK